MKNTIVNNFVATIPANVAEERMGLPKGYFDNHLNPPKFYEPFDYSKLQTVQERFKELFPEYYPEEVKKGVEYVYDFPEFPKKNNSFKELLATN